MMKTNQDWLSRNHTTIYNKGIQTVNYLTTTVLTRIGIAGAALTWYEDVVKVKFNKFKTAYEEWLNPAERTQTKTTVMQETEDAFVAVYRQFYTGYMKDNPLVTDDDLQSCGFPKHRAGGGGKPVKPPTTQVEMEAETSNPAEVIIHYRDAESHHLGKPEGVHGMEFIYRVRDVDAPPAIDWKELTNSVFSTRPPPEACLRRQAARQDPRILLPLGEHAR